MQPHKEGTGVPSFISTTMIDTEKTRDLIREAIAEEGAFLIDVSISATNQIVVLAEHPEGITLEKLGRISRKVENELDREEQDFEIEVSSPGLGSPLKVKEQYQMSVGRPVKIILKEGKEIQADLIDFDGEALSLAWKERVPKEKGKGKQTVQREEKIDLEDIKETRLEIRF